MVLNRRLHQRVDLLAEGWKDRQIDRLEFLRWMVQNGKAKEDTQGDGKTFLPRYFLFRRPLYSLPHPSVRTGVTRP
jgi:hypothetical protein